MRRWSSQITGLNRLKELVFHWKRYGRHRLRLCVTAPAWKLGGLALVSTVSSVLFYCRLYLPSTQLRLLDDLQGETKNMYQKANDERLLPNTSVQMRIDMFEDHHLLTRCQ